MYCELRTQVIVIAIIRTTFAEVAAYYYLYWVLTRYGFKTNFDIGQTIMEVVYEKDCGVYLWVTMCLFVDICCAVGAMKRYKSFLIPFIIVNVLVIVWLVIVALLLVLGRSIFAAHTAHAIANDKFHESKSTFDKSWKLETLIHFALETRSFFLRAIVPVSIVLSLHLYFLRVVLIFCKTISSRAISTPERGMILQPYDAINYNLQQGLYVSSRVEPAAF